MAEVQTSIHSGELTQRFIEFVLMQKQTASLFMGQIAHPQTGRSEVNLDLSKMIIEQLAMVREKTRGNLTGDEQQVIDDTLRTLQLAFAEASQEQATAARGESR